MQKSITLRAFPGHMSTAERIRLAQQAHYAGVEINLEPGEEFTLESSHQELTQLRQLVAGYDLKISAVYSRQQWHHPITSQDRDTRRRGIALVEQLVWAAHELGADAILVVPGAVDNGIFVQPPEIVPYDVAYRNALGALQELAAGPATQAGVNLAIENVWNKFLLSPLEFAQFVDTVGSNRAGVYFDVGNVLRTGIPEHWIAILDSRIKRVHFKDFRLAADNFVGFVGLLAGDVNWPAVVAALDKIGYTGWVTAEVLPAYHYYGERLIFETSSAMDVILAGGEWRVATEANRR